MGRGPILTMKKLRLFAGYLWVKLYFSGRIRHAKNAERRGQLWADESGESLEKNECSTVFDFSE